MKVSMNNLPPQAQKLVEQFKTMNNWQEQYRFIMKAGSQLNQQASNQFNEQDLISGCESQVWLICHSSSTNLQVNFSAKSDSRIVSGLIYIVLGAINQRPANEIIQFNFADYFELLGLTHQLSESRTNGLAKICQKIQFFAKAQIN